MILFQVSLSLYMAMSINVSSLHDYLIGTFPLEFTLDTNRARNILVTVSGFCGNQYTLARVVRAGEITIS